VSHSKNYKLLKVVVYQIGPQAFLMTLSYLGEHSPIVGPTFFQTWFLMQLLTRFHWFTVEPLVYKKNQSLVLVS